MHLKPDKLVHSNRVLRAFKVSSETLRIWHRDGILRIHSVIMLENHYAMHSLQAFLDSCVRNLAFNVSFRDLLLGQERLLTSEEAMEQLGMSRDILHERIRSKRIAALKIHGHWRFLQSRVAEYISANKSNDFTWPQAMHILHITQPVISKLLREGKLVKVATPGNLKDVRITEESMCRHLAEQLPSWISAEDWIDDRLESNRPLLHAKEVMEQLGVSRSDFKTLLEERVLFYLKRKGGNGEVTLISPESVNAFLEREKPLTRLEVAQLYGTAYQLVQEWQQRGVLVCPIPNHFHDPATEAEATWLYPACWIALLQRGASPGFMARTWFVRRMNGAKSRVLTSQNFANAIPLPWAEVIRLAEQGAICGFRAPGGAWRFSERQLEKARKRFKQNN